MEEKCSKISKHFLMKIQTQYHQTQEVISILFLKFLETYLAYKISSRQYKCQKNMLLFKLNFLSSLGKHIFQ